ncbi:MAG: hypothetical protein QF893_18610 [Alphaproteobacteria bacterium]|jgi:drug/metabolite transporter (DMT)-like permease|nr:hypothetical protein [Alphaproteobacteria bacterium]
MSVAETATPMGRRRGVKTKILGVCLLFLGLMDSLLSWRGGFEVSNLYVVLVVLGLVLIVVGNIRQRRGRGPRPASEFA